VPKYRNIQPSTTDRRTVLRLGETALIIGFAGCVAQFDPASLDRTVVNHTATPDTVEIAFFRGYSEEKSDARVYDASRDVPPEDESVDRQAVAEARQYVIR
jgi:hypothetical protein